MYFSFYISFLDLNCTEQKETKLSSREETFKWKKLLLLCLLQLCQFQFVGHLKLSALQKDDFVAKLLKKSYFLITPAYNVKNVLQGIFLKGYIEERAMDGTI